MAFPPAAFIVGAQKAGTTSLANLLDLQGSITLSNPKEPEYFTINFSKGADWFRSCFQGPEESVYIGASTGSSAGPTERFPLRSGEMADPRCGVPARVHGLNPNARFIYLVRDPVARIYSAYWHNVRAGWERRPFRKAIAEDLSYFRISDYAGQLKNYHEFFPKESFLVVSFRDFVGNPTDVVRRCCAHVGVDYREPQSQLADEHKNKSFQLTGAGRFLQRFAGSNNRLEGVVQLGKRIVPDFMHPLVEKMLTKNVPKISDEDRDYLAKLFSESLDELKELTGVDLRLSN